MRRFLLIATLMVLVFSPSPAQQTAPPAYIPRPRLVVGIVVDQMRWDFLYRYYSRYGNGGLRRLLTEGYNCDNTMINYIPSYTAVGHSCIFTGSVPALNGITGNDWMDQLSGRTLYCTSDSTVSSVGNESEDGKMSPRNLLVTTITDELRLASNFQSKVVGVSLKDRAAILPAGHMANAAFWLDDASGHFISSSYYMKELPAWVNSFNNSNPVAALLEKGWNTLYPISTYNESDADDRPYEGKFSGETAPVFPHNMKEIYQKSKGSFRSTPFGNTLTLQFAKKILENYQLGKGGATDFLTINCASTDYVGHMFGPNSVEIEDTYLRLDKDLADFFATLDAKIGKGQYLVFLSADHGVAHTIGFMQQHELPAEGFNGKLLSESLGKWLAGKFQAEGLVRSIMNYQVNFNLSLIGNKNLDYTAIKKAAVEYLRTQPGIAMAVDLDELGSSAVPEPLKGMMANGYFFKRSGGVQLVLNAGWFEGGGKTGTTHGSWNPYDTHIPLIWFGWNIRPGRTNRAIHMTDIAATLAALLHIQMPSGCIGVPIEELTGH